MAEPCATPGSPDAEFKAGPRLRWCTRSRSTASLVLPRRARGPAAPPETPPRASCGRASTAKRIVQDVARDISGPSLGLSYPGVQRRGQDGASPGASLGAGADSSTGSRPTSGAIARTRNDEAGAMGEPHPASARRGSGRRSPRHPVVPLPPGAPDVITHWPRHRSGDVAAARRVAVQGTSWPGDALTTAGCLPARLRTSWPRDLRARAPARFDAAGRVGVRADADGAPRQLLPRVGVQQTGWHPRPGARRLAIEPNGSHGIDSICSCRSPGRRRPLRPTEPGRRRPQGKSNASDSDASRSIASAVPW
jgi:hypothetical protein